MRLVKTATRQWMASARRRASACEETSMTTASSPPATISANSRCRSIASGVVRTMGRSSPATKAVTVPSRPVRRPAASSSPRTRKAEVVLPFVPVTPIALRRAVGSPCRRAAAGAMAARTSSTRTSGTPRPSGRWTTSAAAPRATASGAKSCPSRVNPGTQKNSVPGRDEPVVVGERGHLDRRKVPRRVPKELAERHLRAVYARPRRASRCEDARHRYPSGGMRR